MSNTSTPRPLCSIGRPGRFRWFAAAACAIMTAAAAAKVPMTAITECLESGTDLVRLPAVPGGTLTASECRECPSLRLSFDADTRYFIGEEAVPYARLHEAARRGSLRLYVSYRIDNRTLTRLRLVATGRE